MMKKITSDQIYFKLYHFRQKIYIILTICPFSKGKNIAGYLGYDVIRKSTRFHTFSENTTFSRIM